MGALTTGRRWTVAAIVFAVGLSVVGCAGHPAAVTRFDDAHVDVRLWIEGTGPDRTLVAEFDPFDPTAHLYGMDLPDGGIDGAGRPTRLAVVGGDWRPVGAVTASAVSSEVRLAGFDRPFSIYPDGPVTLRQPIHEVGDGPHDDPVDVTVTFMSCSSKGLCFAPVDQEPLLVPIR